MMKTKRTMLTVAAMMVAIGLVAGAANAALVGELGVFDPANADGGINPQTNAAWAAGDQYRLAFYTSQKHNATSPDINVYNAFVQSVAASSTAYPDLGNGTWKVLGSTATVSARQNTGTDSNVAIPIYVMDGVTRIAVDSDDMWNGFTGSSGSNIRIPGTNAGNIVYAPYLNENGAGDSGTNHGVDIFTGSNSNGTIRTPLGGPNTNSGGTLISNRGASNANNSGRVFIRFDNTAQTSNLSFYALSDPLTVQEAGGGAAPLVLPITDLFNTGVDAGGTPLADGTIGDPHYTLSTVPSGSSTDIRVRTSAGGFPIGPWLGDNSTSAWIGANNAANLNSPPGNYTVDTTFTLPGDANLASVLISGGWATDNPGVDILLNGNSLMASGDILAAELSGGFGGFTTFSFGPGVPFFQHGTNTLGFVFSNAGTSANPAGLRVDNLVGTFQVPEPATMALLSLAACGLGGYVRKRRKA